MRLGASNVMVAILAQLIETLEAVGVDRRTCRDILFGEVNERCRLEIWNNGHAESSRSVYSAFLYGNYYERCTAAFELPASTESGRGPPIQVSSISTSPWRGSRVSLTIARRSL